MIEEEELLIPEPQVNSLHDYDVSISVTSLITLFWLTIIADVHQGRTCPVLNQEHNAQDGTRCGH